MNSPGAADPASWRDELRGLTERLDQPTILLRQLLQEVLVRAVAAVGAAEGSLLIPAGDGRHLRFLFSAGPTADKVLGMTAPLDGSVAGYVFSTGQMTAVGDLAGEQHPHYEEIDKKSGVTTRAYLVVPILSGARPQGVATYVNRPGSPPYQPFQPEEMSRAQAYAGVEGVLLRYWERTGYLARLAAGDLAAARGEEGSQAPAPPAPDGEAARQADPWRRVLDGLEALSEEDQALCAEFIALLGRWRHGGHG